MDKNKQKAPYQTYNPVLIKKLIQKYGVTSQFIRQSLRGERVSETSTSICDDYKKMETEINKTLKQL